MRAPRGAVQGQTLPARCRAWLLLGPDADRKRQRVEQLAASLNVNPLDRHDLAAAEVSPSMLAAVIREHPAAGPARLVIIEDANRLDGACLTLLTEQWSCVTQTACLVFLSDAGLPATHPLLSLGSQLMIERFEWLAPDEVKRWITQAVSTAGKRIEAAVTHRIIHVYGADLSVIRLLLDQLINWAGSRSVLTQDDLQQFLPHHDTVTSVRGQPSPAFKGGFALVEAIARRDVATALQVVHEQLAAGKEVVECVGLLVWQLQRWLTVSRLVEAGAPRERIEVLTGLQPWQLQRTLAQISGRTTAEWHRALRRCWELDVAAKTGRTIPWLALETLVVEMCLPRTNFAEAVR